MDDRAKRARVGRSQGAGTDPLALNCSVQAECSSNAGPNRQDGCADISFLDLPSAILNLVVKSLSYGSLQQLRLASKVALDVVDSASDGWLLKPSELQLLKKSGLLNKLKNLQYMWLEDWNLERYDTDLVDFLHDQRAACERLREVRFHRTVPGTGLSSYSCTLLCHTCTSLTGLCLAPLAFDCPPDGVSLAARSLTCLTALTDLSLEGWAHSDESIKWVARLGGLKKLCAGSFSSLTHAGYKHLSGLTALSALWCHEVSGTAETVAGLSGLTNLRFLRAELSDKFVDPSLSVLAELSHLRTLGWWHRQTIPTNSMAPLALLAKEQASLRSPCAVGPSADGAEGSDATGLQEISLCIDLDPASLGVVSMFPRLRLLQVMSLNLTSLPTRHTCRLTSLSTLVLGCLSPDSLPKGHSGLGDIFPCLENLLLFQVAGGALRLLSQMKLLRRLALHAERLTDEQLQELPSLPSVCSLQLEGCKRVTVRGITSVAAALQPSRLLLVDLHSFGDVCARALLQHMPSLETLSLCALPALSDVGVGLLPMLPALRELHLLRLIRVTAACLPALTGMGAPPKWNHRAAEVAEEVTPSLVEMLLPLANQPNHWMDLAGVIDLAAQHTAEVPGQNVGPMVAAPAQEEGVLGNAAVGQPLPAPVAAAPEDEAPGELPPALAAVQLAWGGNGGLNPNAAPFIPHGNIAWQFHAALLEAAAHNHPVAAGVQPVQGMAHPDVHAVQVNVPAVQLAPPMAPEAAVHGNLAGAGSPSQPAGEPAPDGDAGQASGSGALREEGAVYVAPASVLMAITISQCPRIKRADCLAASHSVEQHWEGVSAQGRTSRSEVTIEWDDVVAANPTLLDEYAFPT